LFYRTNPIILTSGMTIDTYCVDTPFDGETMSSESRSQTNNAERGTADGQGLPGSRGKAIRAIKILLFSASIVPSVLAGAVAHHLGSFNWPDFILLLLAVFLAQAGGDYLYYYFTHLHTDPRDAHTKIFAGWKPFFADTYLGKTGILVAGFGCLAVDLAIGIYFAIKAGPVVLLLAAAGGLIAIFFTPLMLRGFKEPVIFIAFGPLTVMGIVFVLTGRLPPEALAASLPVALWVTVVAHLKGARFEVKERADGEVVIRLGRRTVHVLTALAYVSVVAGVALKWLPPWTLLALVSLPMALRVLNLVSQPTCRLPDYLWGVVRSIAVLILGGLLMTFGHLWPVGG
jgi:1,4-dihydroxy-2-naphthoate octaprenyltransferase